MRALSTHHVGTIVGVVRRRGAGAQEFQRREVLHGFDGQHRDVHGILDGRKVKNLRDLAPDADRGHVP
jgi:hypothetical protein